MRLFLYGQVSYYQNRITLSPALCARVLVMAACFLLAISEARAQNLVPNGDFELYNNCPPAAGGIAYSDGTSFSYPTVQGWVRPSGGTSDYFNACATVASGASVPQNFTGYQPAHFGNAYAGFQTYFADYARTVDIREFISARLIDSLVKDSNYCVRFYINSALPTVNIPVRGKVAVNEIGASFTDTFPHLPLSNLALQLPFHIVNDTNRHLTDTAEWYLIQGVYKAHGGERWITIGTFYESRPPAFSLLYGPSNWNTLTLQGYAYIDDVSVTPIYLPDSVRNIAVCDPSVLISAVDTGHYAWSTGDTTRSIIVTKPGTYTCLVSDECAISKDVFHITFPRPVDSLHNIVLCDSPGKTVVLTSSFSQGPYMWSTGDTTRSIVVSATGEYACRAPAVCGINKDSFHVVLARQVDSTHHILQCESLIVDRDLKSSVVDGSYLWNSGEQTRTIHISKPGIYQCIGSKECLLYREIFEVEAYDAGPPRQFDTNICLHSQSPVLLPGASGITWYTDTSVTGSSVQPSVNSASTGTTILYATKSDGPCTSRKSRITITVITRPVPFLTDTIFHCTDVPADYRGIGTAADPATHYTWNTGDTTSIIKPLVDATFTRQSVNVCGATIDTFVVRPAPCDRCVIFPTAFSPNNDQHNDVFRGLSRCPLSSFHLRIYNRWGQSVYTSENSEAAWDGQFNGTDAPVDNYMYFVYYTNRITNKQAFVKGEVVLIR